MAQNSPFSWKKKHLIYFGGFGFRRGEDVPEIRWCEPGEEGAMEVLKGSKGGFLTKRLKNYESDRNDPLKPKGLSGLSPYLHFGQISAQRCALEAQALRKSQSKVSFLDFSHDLSLMICYIQLFQLKMQ